jgi:hypothetical protein
MEFTAALHTYYQVPAIGDVRVTGLEGTTYSNSLAGGERVVQDGPVVFDREVDRIYINTPAPIRVSRAQDGHPDPAVQACQRSVPGCRLADPIRPLAPISIATCPLEMLTSSSDLSS